VQELISGQHESGMA